MNRSELESAVSEGLSIRGLQKRFKKGQSSIRYWLKVFELKTRIQQPAQKVCAACGNSRKTGAKFCSSECASQFRLKPFDELKTDEARRERLKKELGHVCQLCNLHEWEGQPMPVELDHIDGNPDNNARSNCRLICPNCHALTPTHCGKNIGRFSNTRRQEVAKRYPKYR